MKYKIDKGVPLPASQRKGKFSVLEELEVGDSFPVPDITAPAGIYAKAATLGITVTVRGMLHPSGGYRVWRTE